MWRALSIISSLGMQMNVVREGPHGLVGGEDPGPKVELGFFCSMHRGGHLPVPTGCSSSISALQSNLWGFWKYGNNRTVSLLQALTFSLVQAVILGNVQPQLVM